MVHLQYTRRMKLVTTILKIHSVSLVQNTLETLWLINRNHYKILQHWTHRSSPRTTKEYNHSWDPRWKFLWEWNQIITRFPDQLEEWHYSSNVTNAIEKSETETSDVDALVVVDLGKIASLVDVSGSMCGTLMKVAVVLGLLISEISSP